MYVFCYGDLLNRQMWRDYCPTLNPTYLYRVCLVGHDLVFDGQSKKGFGATANLVENPGGLVWGALFCISRGDLRILDQYEGYTRVYLRKKVDTRDIYGKNHAAWVYFRAARQPGLPSKQYLEQIIKGAIECELPSRYLKKLQKTPYCESA